jgi:hydroxyacylglutathione hydrolase
MVGNRSPGAVAVIDPIRDVDMYLETAKREGVNITHVFETHIHADFVSGSREVAEKTGAKIYLSSHGGSDWQYEFDHVPIKEGDEIYIGEYKIKVIHTPGHTPEHVILTLTDTSRSDEPWMVFTGDFLFVGDIGRPDLLGDRFSEELAEKLYDSVHDKLLKLPDWLEVYPDHGEGSLCGKNLGSKRSTTIGFEKRFNYALKPMSKKDFVRMILQEQPPAPSYFRRMKKVNKEGPRVLGTLPDLKPLGPKEVKSLLDKEVLLVDARSPEAFGGAHISGAYSIPLDPSFPTWVGYIVPPEKPIVLVVERKEDIEVIVRHLIQVGYDDIVGYLDGGVRAWLMEGYPIAEIPQISASELKRKIAEEKGMVILDVRTDSEWNSFRYPFALHMHAGQLPERYTELGLDKEKPVVVTCRSGHRGSIAGSILEQKGFSKVYNLLGGMVAWQNSGGETCSKPGCPEYQEWGPWWHDAINQPKKVTDDIFIGGQPSEADLNAIKAKGFKSIINLRSPSEESILKPEKEESKTKEIGLEYVNIPITKETMNDEDVKRFSEKVKELKKEKAPVFVHCGGGRRAGAVTLLNLAVENGWTVKQAFEKAQSLGFDCESEPELKRFFEDYIKRYSAGEKRN